jgi:hypothetical protein
VGARFPDDITMLLLGKGVEDASRRYGLQLLKQDRYYIYLLITPRTPEDRAEFKRARLTLSKATFLPRQLWIEEANGDETTWDILRIDTGARLSGDEFAVRVPAGWRMEAMPK